VIGMSAMWLIWAICLEMHPRLTRTSVAGT